MYTKNDVSSSVSSLTAYSQTTTKNPVAVSTAAPPSKSQAHEQTKKITWNTLKNEVAQFEIDVQKRNSTADKAWKAALSLMQSPNWEPAKVIPLLQKAYDKFAATRADAQDLIPKIRNNKQHVNIGKQNRNTSSRIGPTPWEKLVSTKKIYTTASKSCRMIQALMHLTNACEIQISLSAEMKEKSQQKEERLKQSEHYKQATDALISLNVDEYLPYPQVANNNMEESSMYHCGSIILDLSQLDYKIRRTIEFEICEVSNVKFKAFANAIAKLGEKPKKEALAEATAVARDANASAEERMSHLDQTRNRLNTNINYLESVRHHFNFAHEDFSKTLCEYKSTLDKIDSSVMDTHWKHVGIVTTLMNTGTTAYPPLDTNIYGNLTLILENYSLSCKHYMNYRLSDDFRRWEASDSNARKDFRHHEQWSKGENFPPENYRSNEARFRLLRHLPAVYEEIAIRLLPLANRMEDELQQVKKTIADIKDKLAPSITDSATDTPLNTNTPSLEMPVLEYSAPYITLLHAVTKGVQEHENFYREMPEQCRNLAVSLHALAGQVRYKLSKLADAGVSRDLEILPWELESLGQITWDADKKADVSPSNANQDSVDAKVEQLAEEFDELMIDNKASTAQSTEITSSDAISKEERLLQKKIQQLERKAKNYEQSAKNIEKELNLRMKAWDKGTQNPKTIFDNSKYNPFEIESCLMKAADFKIKIADMHYQLADKYAASDSGVGTQHIDRAKKLHEDASKLRERAVDKKVKWIMALPTPANINHLFRKSLITEVSQPMQLKDWKRTPSADGISGEVVRGDDDDTPVEDRVIEFTIGAGKHLCVIHFHFSEEKPVPGVTTPTCAHYKTWEQARMSMRSERKDAYRIANAPPVQIWYGKITDNPNEYALQLMNTLPPNMRSVILPKNE